MFGNLFTTYSHWTFFPKTLCEQDVAAVDYRAPSLAAELISSHFSGDRDAAVVLDVACGTGLVAKQVNSSDIGQTPTLKFRQKENQIKSQLCGKNLFTANREKVFSLVSTLFVLSAENAKQANKHKTVFCEAWWETCARRDPIK